MKVEFRQSFLRDLNGLHDQAIQKRVAEAIRLVEGSQGLQEIPRLKKLKSAVNHYRIRIGDYRLGLVIDGNTVIFVRFLHRKDLYRYFP